MLSKASVYRWPPDSAVPDAAAPVVDLSSVVHPSHTVRTSDLPAPHQQQQQQTAQPTTFPQTETEATEPTASHAATAAGVAAGGLAASAAAGATLQTKADTAQMHRHHRALTSRTASILTAGGAALRLRFLYGHEPQPI